MQKRVSESAQNLVGNTPHGHVDQLENTYYPKIKEFIIESCILIEDP